jgi:hypothetical protein
MCSTFAIADRRTDTSECMKDGRGGGAAPLKRRRSVTDSPVPVKPLRIGRRRAAAPSVEAPYFG